LHERVDRTNPLLTLHDQPQKRQFLPVEFRSDAFEQNLSKIVEQSFDGVLTKDGRAEQLQQRRHVAERARVRVQHERERRMAEESSAAIHDQVRV
jgi:hypothetical protein